MKNITEIAYDLYDNHKWYARLFSEYIVKKERKATHSGWHRSKQRKTIPIIDNGDFFFNNGI